MLIEFKSRFDMTSSTDNLIKIDLSPSHEKFATQEQCVSDTQHVFLIVYENILFFWETSQK